MQGPELRRAILEALAHHSAGDHPAPMSQDALSKKLKVPEERLEAHFTFLQRGKYIGFLHMPGPSGERLRFVSITDEGKAYLSDPANFPKKQEAKGPFKVVDKGGQEKLAADFPALRAYIESTEWILDEEKPPILAKVDELEAVLAKGFDAARISDLKMFFERHRWLAPHVSALIRKEVGF